MKTTKIKNSSEQVKKITGIAILLAIEIVLQTIGNYVAFPGGIAINLALIPIALGAIMYGPLAGAILGFINGLVILFAPSTMMFWSYSKIATIVTCLTKCTAAGAISGLLYMLIGKKNKLIGSIVSSLIIPIINTTLFVVLYVTLFNGLYKESAPADMTLLKLLFSTFIAVNFILEFAITTVLTPTINKIIRIARKDEDNAL